MLLLPYIKLDEITFVRQEAQIEDGVLPFYFGVKYNKYLCEWNIVLYTNHLDCLDFWDSFDIKNNSFSSKKEAKKCLDHYLIKKDFKLITYKDWEKLKLL